MLMKLHCYHFKLDRYKFRLLIVILIVSPKKIPLSLAGVAQWIQCQPWNQKVTSSIPSQGTCLRLRATCPVGGV